MFSPQCRSLLLLFVVLISLVISSSRLPSSANTHLTITPTSSAINTTHPAIARTESTSLQTHNMASPQQIKTPLTELLNIKHPVMLAGMNVAAGPKLAAAVTNAGGIGVIGGVGCESPLARAIASAHSCYPFETEYKILTRSRHS